MFNYWDASTRKKITKYTEVFFNKPNLKIDDLSEMEKDLVLQETKSKQRVLFTLIRNKVEKN